MNKKIKKIAKKCNFTEQDIEDMSPGFEMFAKMIVLECAKVADKKMYPERVGDEIKEHFGLK